ncbi:MAG: LacI family DNA-binding transcriptional regulator [Bacteroidia bacterium]
MNRVTIKDIARYLNINPSTVSRALRNHPDVSAKVKESVIQLADKLGYKPNFAAINLRKGKSGIIGLIIPEIANYFFPNVVKAVEEVIHERGYNLLILQSNDSLDREIQNAEICARLGVEGILVSLTRESSDIEHFQELMYNDTPIVFFDKIIHDTVAYKVTIPGEQAAFQAVDFIIKKYKKNKKIAGILGDERLSITQDRLSGFKRALAEHTIKPLPGQIHYAHNSIEAGEIFESLWSNPKRPDCLFLMSDEILEGVMKKVYQLKLNLPQEMKIISMSDGFLPTLYNFEFPYIKTSGYDLGKAAVDLLFNIIDNKPMSTKTYYIDTPLIDPDFIEPLKF